MLGFEVEAYLAEPRDLRSLLALFLRLARDGLQAVPAAALLAITSSHAIVDPTGEEMRIRSFKLPTERIWEFLWAIDTSDSDIDVVVLIAFALLLAWFVWTRRLTLPVRMRVSLIIFTFLAFALPEVIYSNFVIARIVVPLTMLTAVSLRPTRNMDAGSMRNLVATSVGLALFVGAVRLPVWVETQRGVRDFAVIADQVPVGSRVFFAHVGLTPLELVETGIGLYHVASYGVITRQFLVQTMFAFPGQQPLRFRDLALQTAPRSADTFIKEIARNMCRHGRLLREHLFHFDYILMHGPAGKQLETAVMPHPWYSQAGQSGEFRLYRRDPALPVPRPIGHCLRYDLHPAGT